VTVPCDLLANRDRDFQFEDRVQFNLNSQADLDLPADPAGDERKQIGIRVS
jgi:hypothetical protein